MSDDEREHYSNRPWSDNERAAIDLDLRGVRCPMSWVRAKLCLEELHPGALLRLFLDDPKGAADLPRAAEAEGYAVVEVLHDPQAQEWQIVIEV